MTHGMTLNNCMTSAKLEAEVGAGPRVTMGGVTQRFNWTSFRWHLSAKRASRRRASGHAPRFCVAVEDGSAVGLWFGVERSPSSSGSHMPPPPSSHPTARRAPRRRPRCVAALPPAPSSHARGGGAWGRRSTAAWTYWRVRRARRAACVACGGTRRACRRDGRVPKSRRGGRVRSRAMEGRGGGTERGRC